MCNLVKSEGIEALTPASLPQIYRSLPTLDPPERISSIHLLNERIIPFYALTTLSFLSLLDSFLVVFAGFNLRNRGGGSSRESILEELN
jgi:hypothetical protein